jgi:hypothetical protein
VPLPDGYTLRCGEGIFFLVERNDGVDARMGDACMGDTDGGLRQTSWGKVECYLAQNGVAKRELEAHLRQRATMGAGSERGTLTLIAMQEEGWRIPRGLFVEGWHGFVGHGELRNVRAQGSLYEVSAGIGRWPDVTLTFHESNKKVLFHGVLFG